MPAHWHSRAWLSGMAAMFLLTAGCSEGGDPGFRFAAAVEVPVDVTDRDELAGLLATFAQREGLSFRDESPKYQRISNGRQTLTMTIERPMSRSHWNEIRVTADGSSPPWITFVPPPESELAQDARRTQAVLLRQLERRWPGTRRIPMLPGGGVPLREDVRATPQGLRIDPARADEYDLPADSPLLAR